MKRHLLVLLTGLLVTHGAVFAWSYVIENANAKWYALPVSLACLNVFIVGFVIALAGWAAVQCELKRGRTAGE